MYFQNKPYVGIASENLGNTSCSWEGRDRQDGHKEGRGLETLSRPPGFGEELTTLGKNLGQSGAGDMTHRCIRIGHVPCGAEYIRMSVCYSKSAKKRGCPA
jgi:hypothetical protein